MAYLERIRPWLYLIVPLIGAIELCLQLGQTHRHIAEEDWSRVRDRLSAMIQPDDLLALAPSFMEPIGREKLGAGLITLARAARADDSRFARLVEVSLYGAHLGEFTLWPVTGSQHIGAVTLTIRTNPSYEPVLDDLIEHVRARQVRVSLLDAKTETPCAFTRSAPLAGNLGFGPAIPAERFACDGSLVGPTVLADLDYRPRRCLLAPPPGGDGVLRLSFPGVRFGRMLRGHHTINVHTERAVFESPVTISFRASGRLLGRFVHADGDGWKPFAAETGELFGQTAELVVEVKTAGSIKSPYCFEATTR
jgi:hypothetical protein